MRKISVVPHLAACAAVIIMVAGCATTVPTPEFTKQIVPESRMGAKDEAAVKVEAGSGVAMLDSEKMRVAEKIKQKIDARKVTNSRNTTKTYEINLVMTKYEKGNAFARAMFAGLGQIHINADVAVFEMPERTPVGNFSLSKTFAWGGIYGGTTGMEDIETTFADGVALALTGQNEEQRDSAGQATVPANSSSTTLR